MQLREINSQRYYDADSGTYFEFLMRPANLEDAQQMIQTDMECHLNRYPSDAYLDGRERLVLRLGIVDPPAPEP